MTVNIDLNSKAINTVKADTSTDKKKKKKIIKVTIITILILVGITLLCGYFFGEKTGLRLSIIDILNPIKRDPQLKKDSSGKFTNILLVGIDTRNTNPGLLNTDTIILLSYNHEKHSSVMFSIPRDFFVEVPNQGRYTKINSIYAIGEIIEQDTGLEFLKTVVEELTNQEIQYYGMVNLSGFIDLIDALEGIDVDVENTFTDYRYPVEGAEHKYQVVSFQEGIQTMDGQTALRFVRSRLSIDNSEGSDFARARRQQKVILGLKNKILSSETLLNPKKAVNLLNILEQNVQYSDFTNEELQAILKILNKEEQMKTSSFVLDPSLARFKLITDKGLALNAYVIGPIAGLSNYEEIHKYINYAIQMPLLYSEDPTISIYDVGLGYNETLEKVQEFEEKFPYIHIQFLGTLMEDIDGEHLYKTGEEENKLDSKIEQYFSITMTEKPEFLGDRILDGNYIILLGSND